MLSCCVRVENGVPYLTIDGKRVSANAYITYFHEKARYADFAAVGCRLFSVSLFFSAQPINEASCNPPFSRGIFEDAEHPDFSVADAAVRAVLKACPNAYIFPRINLSLSRAWEEAHPEELCDEGLCPDRNRVCFSSDIWAKETERLLEQFLDHTENADYAEHICGYQLAGGHTEEWFPFDQKGSVGKRSREKYAAYLAENALEDTEPTYYCFLSETVAGRICSLAALVKRKTAYRKVVGCFYGYNFERPDRESCHNATESVLACADIDFLCSPVSYTENRRGGLDEPSMVALDSVREHGKLYFAENDARTHLTTPLFDLPYFHQPVFHAREKALAVENIKLQYARALIHSHALWWFDMGGGWFADNDYMALMKRFWQISEEAQSKDMSSVSEVAVVLDADMLNSVRLGDKNAATVSGIRRSLGLMGTPYDVFLVGDFERIKPRYKAFIFVCPLMTERMRCRIESTPNAYTVTSETTVSTDVLRAFCKTSGVHLYCENDAVVYANRSYLFLHTTVSGRYDIALTGGSLRPLLPDDIDPSRDVLKEKTGYLFEIVE